MKKISLEDWEKKIEKIKLDKSDLNKLVMNYLVVEGFKEAAENFREESNTSSK
jgi:glucose-induced degradation protein 8